VCIAELIEMPFMLIVIVQSARWIVRRFALEAEWSVRLGMGSIALMLLLTAELSLMQLMQGTSVTQYIHSRDPVSGSVYALLLIAYALMPLMVR
jgi:hypothetical protein